MKLLLLPVNLFADKVPHNNQGFLLYSEIKALLIFQSYVKFNKMGGVEMALPMDNFLLLSVVNTKLRDYYINLDALCDELDEDKSNIISRLASVGYSYDETVNQFV